jgi:hypothetical protein
MNGAGQTIMMAHGLLIRDFRLGKESMYALERTACTLTWIECSIMLVHCVILAAVAKERPNMQKALKYGKRIAIETQIQTLSRSVLNLLNIRETSRMMSDMVKVYVN